MMLQNATQNASTSGIDLNTVLIVSITALATLGAVYLGYFLSEKRETKSNRKRTQMIIYLLIDELKENIDILDVNIEELDKRTSSVSYLSDYTWKSVLSSEIIDIDLVQHLRKISSSYYDIKDLNEKYKVREAKPVEKRTDGNDKILQDMSIGLNESLEKSMNYFKGIAEKRQAKYSYLKPKESEEENE